MRNRAAPLPSGHQNTIMIANSPHENVMGTLCDLFDMFTNVCKRNVTSGNVGHTNKEQFISCGERMFSLLC